jgi:hypothetical protein
MDCRAKVIDAGKNRALVRVARVNCAECGGCGLLARNREHTMEFEAVDRLGVREGDEVILEVPSRRLSLAYLVIFGLPVVAMAAAYFGGAALFTLAGGGSGQAAGIIAAIVAGVACFWGGVRFAHRLGLSPVIRKIITPADGDGGEAGGENGDFAGEVL